MMLDKTWCMSEECKNECGRKLTDEIKEENLKKRNILINIYTALNLIKSS